MTIKTLEKAQTAKMTAEQARFFENNGYLVIENALSEKEIDALHQETVRLCRGELGPVSGLSPSYADESDEEVIRKTLCIHFPHKLSELVRGFVEHEVIVDVLTHLIGPNVKCMQSMLFIKSAGKPGQAWHQDEDFIPTRDRSLTGAWMALDDATVENGCLWVIPGSHRPGILWALEEQDNRASILGPLTIEILCWWRAGIHMRTRASAPSINRAFG